MKRRLWHLIVVRSTAAIITAITCLVFFVQREAPAQPTLPEFGNSFAAHHTHVKLLLSADAAKPGDTILAGVDMKMDPGWHTYWKNPGDAGSATKIAWTLPPGISAGEIQWPLPQKLPPAEVTTYGYEDEVVLIVPITLEANAAPGNLNLSAKVSWLECKDVCIPANQTVEAKLSVGNESRTSGDSATIDTWNRRVPVSKNPPRFQAVWEKAANGDTRPLIISGRSHWPAKDIEDDSVDFFPDASDDFEVQSATEIISKFSADVRFRKVVKKFSGEWPKEISGTVVIEAGNARYGYDVSLPVGEKLPAMPEQPLGLMLFYAFIGGLILNIMPCVLPVIALKILGFVSEARSEPGRVRVLGLVYTLGVLVSFLTLAGIVIGVNAAGHHAGWGMQFGNPVFIVCLTTLVLLVALNLFGVFEVALGGRALDAAGGLTTKSGASGAFFNGVLATTLATPCTAPFLAPALGFAFSQSAPVIALVFLMVGLGLSTPYIVLSWQPGWLKFLPKPGAWMEKFKNAMGFPMLATVVWLFSVATADYGARVFWLGIFLVIVAFAAWFFGEFFQRGRRRKPTALAIVLILLGGGYAWVLEGRLHWREMVTGTDNTAKSSGEIDWQPWSPEAVAAARVAGRPVLVDFTAAWCVTCNAIVKPALEDSSVAAKLKELNATALLADDTLTPPAIAQELSKYDAAGVPLVLVYPKNPDAPPKVMPQPSPLQLPSSYRGIVLDALVEAGK